MRLKKKNIILNCLIIFLAVFSVNEVKAATVAIGPKFYYHTTKDSQYGSYYGETSGSSAYLYTRFKTLDGAVAWCAQADSYSPKNGEIYTEASWNETVAGKKWTSTQALIAGDFINTISIEKPGYEGYVLAYAALNSYIALNKSEIFSSYNPTILNYINTSKTKYNNIKTTTTLPAYGATATNPILSVRKISNDSKYYVGSFKLTNLIKTYGGDIVTYKINLPEGVTLYKDPYYQTEAPKEYSGVSGDMILYIKATETVAPEFSITIEASNTSTYPIARLWKPTNSKYQVLVTTGNKTYNRKKTAVVTFEVPKEKKTIKVIKKDASNGKTLTGANLKLQLSGASTESCNIVSNNYSCSITIEEELTNDIYYTIEETSSPEGYVKGTTITKRKWDINTSTDTCYYSPLDQSVWNETDIEDCNRTYLKDTVCTKDNGNTYTLGECPLKENQESQSQIDTSETTSTVDITDKTDGTTENICYYQSGENIIKVDDSKCNNQYMHIANVSGNLIVEYYNNKNHVEISKVSISGKEELIGAELKVCSTKPDKNGDCEIVRNNQEGQCEADTSEENEAYLSNEFNCVNNNDGTKTVDMHWVSTSSSKIWYGLKAGKYYLIEITSPSGYEKTTEYIEFSIDKNGKITSNNYDSQTDKIILTNEPTSIKISKQDITTSKELEGATLMICTAYKNTDKEYVLDVGDNGYCTPAVLADGTSATWVSTTEAKEITGLGAGTYYLVEVVAPKGYATAESILFKLNKDGTLTDADGNSIKDNRLIMKDKQIENEKTSEVPVILITILSITSIGACIFSYYYLIKKNKGKVIIEKLRKIITKK